ncbi:hypothetical protein C1J05_14915 [Sulfitobacter sp. JL08]|uniref:hypothetical protein n=1 Tax=Sulfitobacter sp. JL08 TaxID=2070369 RepID=UPI000E0A2B2D|nr:hypothetical protein [Sulfitobacter sp. JL08]AXI55621.1 hypothetical protein C1J05_14915 [Sulfitobacter sp. JL08]
MTRRIGDHELYHALGAACAAVQRGLDVATYDAAILHASATSEAGECAVELPDFDQARSVMQLAAYGPCAAYEGDVIELARKGKPEDFRKAGDLSDRDLELGVDVQATDVAVNILATQHLVKRLKVSGFAKLSKTLRDVGNQNVEPLMLSDFVPRSAALAAVRVARKRLDDYMDPPVERAEAHKMRVKDLIGRKLR